MAQVPTETIVAVVPETVQTDVVVDAKLTVRPELAVALRLTVPADRCVVGIVGKVMD